ncbi:hypothetical protein [uncultured Gammaproteobacteria bacterium]|nr:hypothetical protein [uncultured Gammaproteobacteria bacterium]CAC9649328.1 hypothetical protein [uncultured Gammaproteobacteria bacterium]CAC9649567.1 hypothetical protein [uncultured Gammaproteobacteria bacterium]VVH50665.1 hypothetical protein BPUTSESOX_1811 [uncultured Gammaproteobacteria bacterium]
MEVLHLWVEFAINLNYILDIAYFLIGFLYFYNLISPLIFQFLLIIYGHYKLFIFFWMTWHLIKNKNLKHKFIWFSSFCIMCIGVIFYFWFVCRKIKGQDTVHPLD